VGDGINVAQRIMDFAQGNQVLVSRSYYEVMSRITDDTAGLFQYLGQYEDKHGRTHELYSVTHPHRVGATTKREGPSTGYTATLPVKPIRPLEPEEVHEVEMDLARNIGPLARVLVRKAQPLAPTIKALREALAPTIQEPGAREAFLTGSTSHGHPSQSQPVSRPIGSASRPQAGHSKPPVSGRPMNSQFGAPGPGSQSMPLGSRPASLGQPVSQPRVQLHGQPPSQPAGPGGGRLLEIASDELAIIEHTLSQSIGPMARMLIRKESGRRGTFKEFVGAIAGHIDQPEEREIFLQALKRALPRRQQ
jgi:hypothetical protein